MIAKGNLHAHGQKLAAYLITGKMHERAELMELRGFASSNIREAFIDVQIQAEATRCQKPFFHCYVRLPNGEALQREQWRRIADRIETQLGFEGQGRAVAFHHDRQGGETHMHMAWSRIDLEQMRAIDPGLYKNKLKEVSRGLEIELGLTRVSNEREPEHKTRSPGRSEFEQARRLDTDIRKIREDIRRAWERSDSGKSFTAALAAEGYILARGDRRDFVVIDQAGGDHALAKRITGARAAETRARLADIDKTQLPSVDAAKAMQAERIRALRGPERQPIAPQPAPQLEAARRPIERELTNAARAIVRTAAEPLHTREPPAARPADRQETPALRAAERDAGTRDAGDVAGRVAGGMAKIVGRMFEALADMVSPPPPLTPEQQERQERVDEQEDRDASFRRFVEEQSRSLFSVNEQIRAQERERRREQDDRDARRARDDPQR